MNGARVAGFMWVRLVVGWRWRRIQRPRRGLLRLSQSFELFGRCARRCRLWTVRTNFFFLFREIKRSTSLSFCLCTHKVTCVYASPRNISKKVYIFFFDYYCLAALDSFGVTRTISRKSFDWDCVTCVIFLFSYFHDFSSALFFWPSRFGGGAYPLCVCLSPYPPITTSYIHTQQQSWTFFSCVCVGCCKQIK